MKGALLDSRTHDLGSVDYEMGQTLPITAVLFPFVSSHRNPYRIVQLVSLNIEYAFVNPYFCVCLFCFIAPLKSENDS